MNKAFKYKFLQLAAHPGVFWMFMGMLALYNFQALFNSGGLASGESGFNNDVKYQLLANNYLFVLSFFGLLYAVFLGSRIAGRDIYTGHLGILLCSYPSRLGYYLASLIAVACFLFLVMTVMTTNLLLLLGIFHVTYPVTEILLAFLTQYLNALVLMAATGFFSVIKPTAAPYLGLAGYGYFSMYTFNELPFVRLPLTIDVMQHKDLLCLFFPVRDVMIPSYTPPEVIQMYSIQTLGIPTSLYQILFILCTISLGTIAFIRKDL
jgi:hypothetical protein